MRKTFNLLLTNKSPKSSNGHVWIIPKDGPTDPTADAFDIFKERECAGGMRVGRDFQAKIPPLLSAEERNSPAENELKAMLVWSPSSKLSDTELEEYLTLAREKFQYSFEQALGLLYWHKHDINKSINDLSNFVPHPEEWTIEDKVLFEQAFQFHGKAFDRIRAMLPEKSMSSLIRYYYKWKKLKCKSSVMDRQAKKFSQEDCEEATPITLMSSTTPAAGIPTVQLLPHSATGSSSTNTSFSSSSLQPLITGAALQVQQQQQQPSSSATIYSDSDGDEKANGDGEKYCGNCGVPYIEISKEGMCNTCLLYWKKTGEFRPLTGPLRRGLDRQALGLLRHLREKRVPPKGMYINHDDISLLASVPPQADNVSIQGLEREVLEMKSLIQGVKQNIELLHGDASLDDKIEKYKPKEAITPSSGINNKWTTDELNLAAQGVRRYGKDFEKIAQVIGTKTEAHLKSFYATHRKKFDLDALLQEYDMENQGSSSPEESSTKAE